MTQVLLRRKNYICFVLFLVCCFAPQSHAQELSDFFDKKTSYDIYIQGYKDSLSVISDVEILRFEQLGNKTFLVIKPSSFTLSDSEGFIDFTYVRAILPFRKLKINKKSPTKIHYR